MFIFTKICINAKIARCDINFASSNLNKINHDHSCVHP